MIYKQQNVIYYNYKRLLSLIIYVLILKGEFSDGGLSVEEGG